MSTPKRKKIRQQTYEKRFDELKAIHRFSFRKRKNFTPSQKAAITRLYRKYRFILSQLETGRGVFKKTTKSQNRALKRAGIQREGFTVTNKGIIAPGVRVDEVKKGRQKVIIKGKGKKTRVQVQLPAKREEFVPYIDELETFPDFVRRLIKTRKPDDLAIQNEAGRGRDRYTPKTFMRYVERDIQPRIEDFQKRYGLDRNPFTGVWLIWYKFKRK